MPSAVRVVDRIQDQGDFASALSWAGKQTFQTSILVGSGTVSVGTSGVGVVVIGTSTVPTTAPADEVQLYSADWEGTAGDARLHVYSETGTTVIVGNGTVIAKKPASGAGTSLTLAGSAAVSGNTNGGDLALSPGAKSGSGADGNVTLARGKFVFPGGPTLAAPGVNMTTLDAPGQAQGSLVVTANGVTTACVQIVGSAGAVSGGVWMSSINLLGWSPSNPPTASIDTSFSRAAAGVVRVGNGNTGSGGLSSAANSPAQLTADQNNYAPGVGLFQRWSSDASRTVTGVDPLADPLATGMPVEGVDGSGLPLAQGTGPELPNPEGVMDALQGEGGNIRYNTDRPEHERDEPMEVTRSRPRTGAVGRGSVGPEKSLGIVEQKSFYEKVMEVVTNGH